MSDSTIENRSTTEAVSDLQSDEFTALAAQVRNNRKQLQQSLKHLQECLDHLRLVIKYQAFDLEATRRENADLRTLLEIEGHPKQ
jgi:hypothetical protein